MKKIFYMFAALVMIISIASCGAGDEVAQKDTVPETNVDVPVSESDTNGIETGETRPDGDYLDFTDDDGRPYYLEIFERIDISLFKIVSQDTASETFETALSTLRGGVIEKTELDVVTDPDYVPSESEYEIIMSEGKGKAEGFSSGEYAICFEDNRIYLLSGSGESMMNAVSLFLEYFVDASQVKMTEDYRFSDKYFLGNITVDGVNISEFSVTFDPDDYACESPKVISEEIAKKLSKEFVLLETEKGLSYTDRIMSKKHYIVISAHSLDIHGYSVSIEDGNIYVRGSYYSVDEATELLMKTLKATRYEHKVDLSETLELTSDNSITKTLDFVVPYTKSELLAAFEDAQSRDDMIISGAHAFNWKRTSNGVAVGPTLDLFYDYFGDTSAIMEFDLGRYSVLSPENNNEEGLSEYDISKLISDCADHVAKGGIISISAHTINPLTPEGGFRGGINSNELYKEIYTEGTEINKNYLLSISPVMRVLKAFHDNGIPVIYRPFHEMTGDWFWWCIYQPNGIVIEADIWTGLWKYLHNHVTNELGLDNVLWSYAAAGKNALYPYPGDEYTDIVGIDWYTGGNREVNVEDGYPLLMTSGKPIGLTEFGGPAPSTGYSCESMLLDLKWMMEEGLDVDFFVLWTTNGSFIGMQKGDVLFGDPIIYTRSDMLAYWNK